MFFTLIGISSDPSDHPLLRPDYAKPLQDVVHNAIRYWLESAAVAMSQIMHFLAHFKAVSTILLVPSVDPGCVDCTVQSSMTREAVKVPYISSKRFSHIETFSTYCKSNSNC